MASYHRILQLFGRSTEDRTLQCDCDLQPWQISIDNEQWSGKMRLIGFIDIIFIIAYSQQSIFHHGLVIYKNEEDVDKIATKATISLRDLQRAKNSIIKGRSDEAQTSATPEVETPLAAESSKVGKYLKFSHDMMEYRLSGIGHEIGLKTKYAKSDIRRWNITVRKPENRVQRRHIKKAFKQHDTVDLAEDAIKLGFVSYSELLGHGATWVTESGFSKGFMGSVSANSKAGEGGVLSGGHL